MNRFASINLNFYATLGSNVIIYPQKIWFAGVLPDDVEEIVSTMEGIVGDYTG